MVVTVAQYLVGLAHGAGVSLKFLGIAALTCLPIVAMVTASSWPVLILVDAVARRIVRATASRGGALGAGRRTSAGVGTWAPELHSDGAKRPRSRKPELYVTVPCAVACSVLWVAVPPGGHRAAGILMGFIGVCEYFVLDQIPERFRIRKWPPVQSFFRALEEGARSWSRLRGPHDCICGLFAPRGTGPSLFPYMVGLLLTVSMGANLWITPASAAGRQARANTRLQAAPHPEPSVQPGCGTNLTAELTLLMSGLPNAKKAVTSASALLRAGIGTRFTGCPSQVPTVLPNGWTVLTLSHIDHSTGFTILINPSDFATLIEPDAWPAMATDIEGNTVTQVYGMFANAPPAPDSNRTAFIYVLWHSNGTCNLFTRTGDQGAFIRLPTAVAAAASSLAAHDGGYFTAVAVSGGYDLTVALAGGEMATYQIRYNGEIATLPSGAAYDQTSPCTAWQTLQEDDYPFFAGYMATPAGIVEAAPH